MSNKNSSAAERFRKRKKIKNSYTVYEKVDQKLVDEFLDSETNENKVNQVFQDIENFYDVSVSKQEAEQFLAKFKKDFNDERFNQLITDCKKDIINSIVTPFGLGNIVAAYDKVGGNVTTMHNFEKGIVATDEDKQRYEEWQKVINPKESDFILQTKNRKEKRVSPLLQARKVHDQKKAEWKKRQYSNTAEGEHIIDGYTNKELGTKQNNKIINDRGLKADIDAEHITPVAEIERNSKNHLYIEGKSSSDRLENRADISSDESNLTLIDGGMNSSKGDKDLMQWESSKVSKQHAQETGNPNMTNAEYYDLDEPLAKEQYRQSKAEIRKNEIKNQIKKQGSEILNTGASEGGKMALQQALGLVITEFFTATFDEIIDIYKNGFYTEFNGKFFSVLKKRIKRIGARISAKWKDVIIAAKDGFISGFISNLVTVVINAFVTTGTRIVRIIREGIFSLFKAVKVLLFPPEGMSFEDRMHEAKKLIATGLIVSVGVIVEEYIDKLIRGTVILEPFTDILTTVLIGSITGLSITIVVYYLDKKKNDEDAINVLLEQTDQSYQNIERMMTLNP
ncbi:MAG: hypothetical protein KGV46_01760 [Pasteurella sp.]|nr:hypothetical protein [Pasteurella sp.]